MTHPAETRTRLLNLLTFAAVGAAVWLGFFEAVMIPMLFPEDGLDFRFYMDAGQGNLTQYFYPSWLLPLWWLLSLLPFSVAWMISNVANFLGCLYGLHVFKGNKAMLFLTFPYMGMILLGQVEGIVAFGLALTYVALQKDQLLLVTLGLLIAFTKFQIGIPIGLGILLLYGKWSQQWRVIALLAVWGLLSNILWPLWVLGWLERMQSGNLGYDGSISFWKIFGPLVLVMWLPFLLAKNKTLPWFVTIWVCTVPYLQPTGLVVWLLFPVGITGWLTQVGFAVGLAQGSVLLSIGPVLFYVWCCYRAFWVENAEANPDTTDSPIMSENAAV